MKIHLLFLCAASVLLLNSCGFLFAEVIAPSHCKKCQIISEYGEVVDEENGCGGEVYNMEQRVKAKAYDYGCGYTVHCETYKEEVPEGNSGE